MSLLAARLFTFTPAEDSFGVLKFSAIFSKNSFFQKFQRSAPVSWHLAFTLIQSQSQLS